MPQAAAQPEAYALQGTSHVARAISAGATNAAGQPTQRFVKDLIRVGRFTGGGGSHQIFEVTRDQHDPANGKFSLQHFRDQYVAMRLAGIDVPTPNGHTNDAEANRGYVRDMFIEGDTLYGVIEAIGQDAIQLMSRAKVSINVPIKLQGGNGKSYDYPIDHVAIVTNPVIPEQNGFVAIAASRDNTGKVNALVLAPENPAMPKPDNTPAPSDKPKATDLASLAASLGIQLAEGQDAAQAIGASFAAMKAKITELEEKTKQPANSDVVVAASLDPNVAGVMVENAELKLSRLVEEGRITAAVCDELKTALVGTAAKPVALTLSIGKQGEPSIFSRVIEILGKNNPVELKEKTKGQNAIVASRAKPEDDKKITDDIVAKANAATPTVAL